MQEQSFLLRVSDKCVLCTDYAVAVNIVPGTNVVGDGGLLLHMVRRWRGTLTQPFAVKLFAGIWNSHPRFATKTVLVKNNDVDSAFSLLNRLMDAEGLLKIIRRTQFYQKPFMQRKQLSFEASAAIFNEDMDRKMRFLLRKNRPDAFPGQITS